MPSSLYVVCTTLTEDSDKFTFSTNAFELFGLDFLIAQEPEGQEVTTYLLEVNAFPDFRQTGEELRDLVGGLFGEVVDVAVKPFFGLEGPGREGSERMRCVLDVDLGRR